MIPQKPTGSRRRAFPRDAIPVQGFSRFTGIVWHGCPASTLWYSDRDVFGARSKMGCHGACGSTLVLQRGMKRGDVAIAYHPLGVFRIVEKQFRRRCIAVSSSNKNKPVPIVKRPLQVPSRRYGPANRPLSPRACPEFRPQPPLQHGSRAFHDGGHLPRGKDTTLSLTATRKFHVVIVLPGRPYHS